MLCNWCHKKISQGGEYREKGQGGYDWLRESYRYEGGGYYHLECYKKYREWKNKWQWTQLLLWIWFGVAIIISVGLGVLFKSVLVGLIVGILLVALPFIIIYFWWKWKISQILKDSTSQSKKFEDKILTCRNCKQKYFDFYSQRKPNKNYVFKWEEGYCMPCTHKLFYPETISKCKVCKVTFYVKDNKEEGSDICQECHAEKKKQEEELVSQERIRERIKQEKQKNSS